ncbi:NAD(P)H-dependent oxidoreductase [Cysteiniphilum sp. JM-1]|uniref:NAD(P)H-dependent oxidoreductase n=1 Tax=Cysteiniphilum sp. JM-1 TaxID=2610891 RepID=UPI001243FDAA|nr:NAD(P)H-dependent oxidoreductase [Cysteiniphilum sp. JM-1]
MKKILIINAKKHFGHSKGALNQHMSDIAQSHLRSLGHEVRVTVVEDGYNIEDEINHILWADVVIYQMPAWWMGPPWTVKKYIDEVFTYGHGRLYVNDGRSRADLSKKYGSGGLLHGKKYMLSVTWNAPTEAFEDPKQFFEGAGVDGVYLPVHKANQFLGMQALPTFMSNDVIKDPQVISDVDRYKKHLDKLFSLECVQASQNVALEY